MHEVKTGVQNMYMKCTCTSPRISVTKALRSDCLTFLFAVVFRWSSYLATTVRSAPVVSLRSWNILVGCLRRQSGSLSNSDETGPGERTREGDHRLKV